jgi:CubicO group peptidase (beta-lactamase class C family)
MKRVKLCSQQTVRHRGLVAACALLSAIVAIPAIPASGVRSGAAAPGARSAPATLTSRLDAYVSTVAQGDRFAGAVLVARGKSLLLAKGYGLANVERKVANTAATQFRIGSITKTFTAGAVFQLVQRGRLSLDDSVCTYLEACPPRWRPITIRMLLAHTAGLSDTLDDASWKRLRRVPLPRVVARLRTLPLAFKPGTRWSYCNACYLVAGLIVERVAGVPWLSYLRQHIFRPAGMKSTTYDTGAAGASEARAYVPNRFGVLVPQPTLAMADLDTAGGLKSTVTDLDRFSRALDGDRLLSRRFRKLMFEATKASHDSWSLGWEIGSRRGHRIERHTGSVGGWGAVLTRYPDLDLTVVVLANLAGEAVAQINHNLPAIVLGWSVTLAALPPLTNVSPSLLANYVGVYVATSHGRLRLEINRAAGDASSLVLFPGPYGGGDRLGAMSKRRFIDLRAPHWSVEFRVNGGRATSVVVRSTRPRISFVARRIH